MGFRPAGENEQIDENLAFLSIENATDPIYWIDPEGKIMYVNKAACESLGYHKQELLELKVMDVDADHDDSAVFVNRWDEIKNKGKISFESKHIRKEGTIFPVQITVHYIKRGENEFGFSYVKNIEQQKQEENNLRHNLERLQDLFDTLDDFIFIIDSEGNILNVNDAIRNNLGYKKKELIGRPAIKLHPPEMRERAKHVLKRIMDGDEEQCDIPLITKEGRLIPVETRCTKTIWDGKQVLYGVSRDISSRKEKDVIDEILKDFAISLNQSKNFDEIFALVLETVIKVEEIDSGGIYLFDENENLILKSSRGLSKDFTDQKSFFDRKSKNVEIVQTGEAFFTKYAKLKVDHINLKEGLRFIGVLPIKEGNSVTGSLNVASHFQDQISDTSRAVLELIANQVGYAIKRTKVQIETHTKEIIQHTLLESMAEGVILIDISHSCFTYCNNAIFSMFEYEEDEFLTLHLEQLFSDKQTPRVLEAYKKVLDGQEVDIEEISCKKRNGDLFYADLRFKIISRGDKSQIVLFVHDITEKVIVRREIESQKQEAENLLQIAGTIIVSLDTDGRVTLINKTGREILNCTESEIIGRKWFEEIVPKDQSSKIVSKFHEILEGNIELNKTVENDVVTFDGKRKTILWSNIFLKDENGEIEGTLSSGLDITPLKKMELKLVESEEKYRELVEYANSIILRWATDGKIIFMNEFGLNFFGYTLEELSGKDVMETIVPSSDIYGKDLVEMINNITSNPDDFQTNINENLKRDGTRAWISWTNRAIKGNDGNVIGILSVGNDITKQREMVQNLKQSQHKYQILLDRYELTMDSMDYAIHVIDRDLKVLMANKELKRWGGLYGTTFHPVGKSIMDVFPFLDESVRDEYQWVFDNNEVLVTEDLKNHSGTDLHSITKKIPINEGGKVTQIITVLEDISSRKQSERILSERNNLLNSIFQAAPIGIGLVSNRKLLQVNEKILEVLGYKEEELLEKDARILYPSDEDYTYVGVEKYKQIEEKGTGTVETRWKTKNGDILQILLSSTPLDPDNLEKGVTFTALDITQRKLTRRMLEKSEARFRKVFNESPIAMLIFDGSGYPMDVNKACMSLFGLREEKINSLKIFSINEIIEPLSTPMAEGEATQFNIVVDLDNLAVEHDIKLSNMGILYLNVNVLSMGIKNDPASAFLVQLVNITEQIKAEHKLQQQLEIENMISQISSKFIALPNSEIDAGIHQSLRQLGRYFDVDRAYIYKFIEKPNLLTMSHEWHSGQITPLIQEHSEINIKEFPWLMEKMNQSEPIIIQDVGNLSDDISIHTKKSLLAAGIQSILFIPLISTKNEIIGHFGFETLYKVNEWSKDIIGLLEFVGKIYASALELKQIQQKLRENLDLEDIIARISTEFINMPLSSIDESIYNALKLIGKYINADRTAISNLDHESGKFNNAYQWHSDKVNDNTANHYLSYKVHQLPKLMNKLRHGGVVKFNSKDLYVSKLIEDPLIRYFEEYEIGSLIIIPLIVQGKLKGIATYMVFDTNPGWSDDTVLILKLVSEIITNALERKNSEQKLKESEDKYKVLVKNSPNYILLSDLDGNIVDCNPKATHLLGLSVAELKRLNVFEIAKIGKIDLDKTLEQFEAIKVSNSTINISFPFKGASNEEIWLECVLSRISINNKPFIQCVANDVTERHRAEDIIIQEIEKLKELDSIRNEFIYRASHELKTPLNSINSAIDLIMNYYDDEFDEKVEDMHKIIKKGGERLTTLINTLVDINRFQLNSFKLEPIETDMARMITECVEDFYYQMENRELNISLHLPESLHFQLDPIRFNQVFSNLLSNAIKNTPRGGNIFLKATETKEYVQISIEDNGIGFTPEEKERIFRKFGKIERYGKGYDIISEGSGLGLYISKQIVEMHGGEIWVESDGRNMGSTFHIRLFK